MEADESILQLMDTNLSEATPREAWNRGNQFQSQWLLFVFFPEEGESKTRDCPLISLWG